MRETRCSFCGNDDWEEREVEYLYSFGGKYLLVPNMPARVCLSCGMTYYPASALKHVERDFFAIQNHTAEPDRYIEMPEKAYTTDDILTGSAQFHV